MDSQHEKSLVDYVRNELSRYTPTDTILENMTAGGWPADEVKKILSELQNSKSALSQTISSPHEKKTRHHHIMRSVVCLVALAILGFLTIAYMLGGP